MAGIMAVTITERGQRLGHAGTITGPGMTGALTGLGQLLGL